MKAAIALGSNLGDRDAILDSAVAAIRALPGTEVLAVSRWIETDPVGPGEQGRYLNGAAVLETTLTPRDLLDRLLAIERAHGRDRSRETRWGPRRLDLDLLVYGQEIIDEEGLAVPHPRLHERRFVLDPLCEILPEWRHPVLGRTVAELRKAIARGASA